MRDNLLIWAMYGLLVCFLALFAVTVNAQEPVPVGGPITEALERKLDGWFKTKQEQDTKEMSGILDRLRDNQTDSQKDMKSIRDWFKVREDQSVKEMESIRDWFKDRNEQSATQFQGLRGMIQRLLDRDPTDNSAIFPRINTMFSGLETRLEARQMQRWTPIVDRMNMFASALMWLGVGLIVFIMALSFAIAILFRMIKRIIPEPVSLL